MRRLAGITTLLLVFSFFVAAQEQTEPVRPLYGVQGVLVETVDGKIVSSQNENEQFNPASTMKLATAFMALRTLGPDHRFATAVWTDGQLDKTTGSLSGNLYISGRDPSDRKSTRLNSSHSSISYAVFCLKKKRKKT